MARSHSDSTLAAGYEPGRLMLAVKNNDLGMARQILESLPDRDARLLNVADDWGYTALHVAAEEDKVDMCRFLIARNANIRIKDAFGSTALHHAASGGSKNVIDLLIARKAPLDVRNDTGKAALHLAASRGHIGIVEALVLSGADATLKDADGKTPLRLAREGAQTVVAVYLAGVEREQVHSVYKEMVARKREVISAYNLAQNEARYYSYRARVLTVTPATPSKSLESLRTYLVNGNDSEESTSSACSPTVFVDPTSYSIETNQSSLWEEKSPAEKKDQAVEPPSPHDAVPPHKTRRDAYNVAIARFIVSEILKRAPIAKANVSQQDLKRKALEDPGWINSNWDYEEDNDAALKVEEKPERADGGDGEWIVIPGEAEEEEEEVEKKFRLPIDKGRVPEEVQDEIIDIWKEMKKSGNSEQLSADTPLAQPNISVRVWEVQMNAASQFSRLVWPLLFSHKTLFIVGYDQEKAWNKSIDDDDGESGGSLASKAGMLRAVRTERNVDVFLRNVDSIVAQVPAYRYALFGRNRRSVSYVSPAFILAGLHDEGDEMDYLLRSNLEKVHERISHSSAACHLPDGGEFVFSLPSEQAERTMRRYVEQTLRKEPFYGEKIPVRWLIFEHCVDTLKSLKRIAVTRRHLTRIVQPKITAFSSPTVVIPRSSDFKLILNYYHDSGYLLYYDVPKLSDIVFLSPQWLFDFLHEIFSLTGNSPPPPGRRLSPDPAAIAELRFTGHLVQPLVQEIINAFSILDDDEEFNVIDLLEGFDFLVKVPSRDGSDMPACYIPLLATVPFQPSTGGICNKVDGCITFLEGYCPMSLFNYLAGVFLVRRYGQDRRHRCRFSDGCVLIQMRANIELIMSEKIDHIAVILLRTTTYLPNEDEDDDDDSVDDSEFVQLCAELNKDILEDLGKVKSKWIPGLLAELEKPLQVNL